MVEEALVGIRRRDGAVNAFCAVWEEWARDRAAEVDAAVARGAELWLAGVPIGVKRSEGVASFQARRLVAAGAVPVGATAVPGPGTEWKTWGATDRGFTVNPRRPGLSPGGSSAGSGAAVAAGLVPLATASDGAGSTRIPAAWSGRMPARDAAGLTVGGPIARRVADADLYRRVVLGERPTDGHGRAAPRRKAGPLRVAWSATLGFNRVHAGVAETAAGALGEWERSGAITVHEAGLDLDDPGARWRALRASPAMRPVGVGTWGGDRNAARLGSRSCSPSSTCWPLRPHRTRPMARRGRGRR